MRRVTFDLKLVGLSPRLMGHLIVRACDTIKGSPWQSSPHLGSRTKVWWSLLTACPGILEPRVLTMGPGALALPSSSNHLL